MKAIGIKVLKNRLSEYVKQAAGGEIILVIDRDRIVAELGPPRENRPPLLADAVLEEAARRGLYTPPISPGGIPPAGIPAMTGNELPEGLESILDGFSESIRTLDAIHLATMTWMRDQRLAFTLATYDWRLADAAEKHGISVMAIEG